MHEIYKEKQEQIQENLKEIADLNLEDRENILEYQREFIMKSNDKDHANDIKKNSARENIILANMEMERKLNQFNKDMNKLKDQNMSKLSYEKRKKMYLDMLKAEAEKKKKEEEEKLLLANK